LKQVLLILLKVILLIVLGVAWIASREIGVPSLLRALVLMVLGSAIIAIKTKPKNKIEEPIIGDSLNKEPKKVQSQNLKATPKIQDGYKQVNKLPSYSNFALPIILGIALGILTFSFEKENDLKAMNDKIGSYLDDNSVYTFYFEDIETVPLTQALQEYHVDYVAQLRSRIKNLEFNPSTLSTFESELKVFTKLDNGFLRRNISIDEMYSTKNTFSNQYLNNLITEKVEYLTKSYSDLIEKHQDFNKTIQSARSKYYSIPGNGSQENTKDSKHFFVADDINSIYVSSYSEEFIPKLDSKRVTMFCILYSTIFIVLVSLVMNIIRKIKVKAHNT